MNSDPFELLRLKTKQLRGRAESADEPNQPTWQDTDKVKLAEQGWSSALKYAEQAV